MKKSLSFLFFLTINSWCFLAFGQNPKVIQATDLDPQYQIKKDSLNKINASPKVNIPNAPYTKAAPACFEPFSNTGGNGWIEVPRGDDDSYGPIALGWNFSLFGTNYSSVYINTNGNISFGSSYYTYTPSGFPVSTPMIAAFWADIDTRNTTGGSIWYKVFPDKLVVSWDRVGSYNQNATKLNSFQLTIKANTAPTFTGDDVLFSYDDMQWTTGSLNGGSGGFGGTPATAGMNKGDNLTFIQTGRFNLNSSAAPNTPPGAAGGIDWLDGKCLSYLVKNSGNTPPAVAGLPANNQMILNNEDSRNLVLQFSGPETNQNVSIVPNLNNVCGVGVRIDGNNTPNPIVSVNVIGSSCNLGTNYITLTATDNGTPAASQTFTLAIVVNNCQTDVQLVNVTDDISKGNNIVKASQVNGKITATNKVLNGSTKTVYNARSINLNSGFRAETGTIFIAEVGGCN